MTMEEICQLGLTIEGAVGQDFRLCNVFREWSSRTGTLRDIEEPVPVTNETLFKTYPALARMSRGNNWQLLLELDQGLAVVNPTTMFWINPQGERSRSFDLNDPGQAMYLEFLITIQQDEHLRSLALVLQESADESLAIQIDEGAIARLVQAIDVWLDRYTQNPTPFVINGDGVVRGEVPTAIGLPPNTATCTAQIQLLIGCIYAFQATRQTHFRERMLTLASALITYFYRSIPVTDDVAWYPHAYVNAGNPFVSHGPIAAEPERYGFVDVAIEFVNGVGQLPTNLAQVYQVYEGQLSDRKINADLREGQTYGIESWVDANGNAVMAKDMPEQTVEPQGEVIYASARDTSFNLTYSIFIYALI